MFNGLMRTLVKLYCICNSLSVSSNLEWCIFRHGQNCLLCTVKVLGQVSTGWENREAALSDAEGKNLPTQIPHKFFHEIAHISYIFQLYLQEVTLTYLKSS
jgi:hypothetical protein